MADVSIEFLSMGTRKLGHYSPSEGARALLGWSQADLAERSGVSEPTVARLEFVHGELGGREGTTHKIRAAIEIGWHPIHRRERRGAGSALTEAPRPLGV